MKTISTTIDGVEVTASYTDEMPKEEILEYIKLGRKKYGTVKGIEISQDGEYVNVRYHINPKPFERIRRITGYLVGTLDRFNNAKKAEEKDRVKHDA